MKIQIFIIFIICLTIIGCAGIDKSLTSCCATNIGADWVIVQLDMNGNPIMCWKVYSVSLTSENTLDGIYWKDTKTGNLIHLSGWYNFVQVSGNNYEQACKTLNIVCDKCIGGKYDNGHN